MSAARQLLLGEDDGNENAPLPQSNAYESAAASAGDGSSAPVKERMKLEPSLAAGGVVNVAVGATFRIATVRVYSAAPPSLSVR